MNKKLKINIAFVVSVSLILLSVTAFYIMSFKDIKYGLENCVRYFDPEARFQLMNFGHYVIDDLSDDNGFLFDNVLYYRQDGKLVYVVYGLNSTHCAFGVLNVDSGETERADDYSKLKCADEFSDFQSKMIDLTVKQNAFEYFLRGFVPQKYRSK